MAVLAAFFTGFGRFFTVISEVAAAVMTAFFYQPQTLSQGFLQNYRNHHDVQP